jgi:carbamoyl-phosphate synthase large subunit
MPSRKQELSGKNVLVTSISHKVPMLKAVRCAMTDHESGMFLHGGDSNRVSPGRYFVDKFWKMPQLDDSGFPIVLDYCRKHKIGRIIPSRDGELLFWARHRNAFAQKGIRIMIAPLRAVALSLDKLQFHNWAVAHEFPAIPTAGTLKKLKAKRLVVKERFGAGSAGILLDCNRQTAERAAANFCHPVFQPYIKGQELSVDIYVDRSGKSKGAIVRERNLVVGGESFMTTVIRAPKIEKLCQRMAEQLGLYGHAIFQIMQDYQDNCHIIECNARFGGASVASLAAGLDSFGWFLQETGGHGRSTPFARKMQTLTMVRYKTDLFLP